MLHSCLSPMATWTIPVSDPAIRTLGMNKKLILNKKVKFVYRQYDNADTNHAFPGYEKYWFMTPYKHPCKILNWCFFYAVLADHVLPSPVPFQTTTGRVIPPYETRLWRSSIHCSSWRRRGNPCHWSRECCRPAWTCPRCGTRSTASWWSRPAARPPLTCPLTCGTGSCSPAWAAPSSPGHPCSNTCASTSNGEEKTTMPTPTADFLHATSFFSMAL